MQANPAPTTDRRAAQFTDRRAAQLPIAERLKLPIAERLKTRSPLVTKSPDHKKRRTLTPTHLTLKNQRPQA
jgi:hypothetical protein